MILAATLLFAFGACTAVAISSTLSGSRWRVHASVSVAVLPLAALVAVGISVSAEQFTQYLHEAARFGVLPSSVSRAILQVRPMDLQLVTLLDVQLVAILLFFSYATILILRHLADVSRYLKISRRRLFTS